ncbi:MAG: hypothetical protein AAFP90_16710 [Planctomycetota bacterium]
MSISKARLQRYHELTEERKRLERQARSLKTESDIIMEEARTALKESGKQQIKRSGFVVHYVPGRATVRWKDAFIARCGSAAAEEVQAAASAPQAVAIVPPLPEPSEPTSPK